MLATPKPDDLNVYLLYMDLLSKVDVGVSPDDVGASRRPHASRLRLSALLELRSR